MDQLVQNLIAAYRADIGTLDWMSPQTRQKALDEARQARHQDRLSRTSGATTARSTIAGR